MKQPDLLIVGSGPSGMMAGIAAASRGISVVILEQMKKPGMKLLATGGRRCNLTNTKNPEGIMADFGRTGRFMEPAMKLLNNYELREFFHSLGVATHSPDGFRVWPTTHKSTSIHRALLNRAEELGIRIVCDCTVEEVLISDGKVDGALTSQGRFDAKTMLLATGGLSLSSTGATGSGYDLARHVGHKIKPTFPSGVPLFAREEWTASCTADTIPKVRAKINIARAKELNGGRPMKGIKDVHAGGDLIFSRKGIAGPLALNLSRFLATLLDKYVEIPIELNLAHGYSEGSLFESILKVKANQAKVSLDEGLKGFAPLSLRQVMFDTLELKGANSLGQCCKQDLGRCAKFLTKCQLTIFDTAGYIRAIATKGGVDLKAIDPKTLMSRSVKGLYFSGELVDMDGPCGGYNLTWAFTSGHLAGVSAALGSGDIPGDMSSH